MKNAIAALAAAGLLVFVGCNTGTPGGPGADKAKASEKDSTLKKLEDKIVQPAETFSLKTPTLATKLKQGESKEITIGIKRGKNFDQDVTVKFDGVPTGVTIDPASPTIKKGDTEAKVMVKVADDAAVGDFTVKTIGKPGKGDEAANEFTLTVAKK
jgi:uncharacterized membrane protein